MATVRLCVEGYLGFVRDIHRLAFRQIVPFGDYVTKPDSLITYINHVYQLNLKFGEFTQTGVEAVHVFPSEERERLKQSFTAIVKDFPEIKSLMQTAKHYHDALIAERILPDDQ